jgi:hypothetical protein
MTQPMMRFNIDKLHTLVKGLDKNIVVKVGIFGDKAARKEGPLTNADVGLVHEVGSYKRNIPMRSFLRMPLFQKSKEIIAQSGKNMKKLLAEGNKMQILKNLGVACEAAIGEAFNTKGFGLWRANKTATRRAKLRRGGFKGKKLSRALKLADSPLIDTGQLQRSISSKVEVK